MSKLSEATFYFTPSKDGTTFQRMKELVEQPDFIDFIIEKSDTPVQVTIENAIVKSRKKKMNKFLRGPLIESVVLAYRDAGYRLDKADALTEMKARFGKELYKSPIDGDTYFKLLSIADITNQRLLTFIQDIIGHLQEDLGWFNIPDSEEYKKRHNIQ